MDAEQQKKRRVVAIVGRPNVGKSAIFNRLVGNRVAIVHEQAGCTRDRLMREASWGEQRFELIDTGGICNMDNSSTSNTIEAGIRNQAEAAIADSAVAILAVDITTGVIPMDLEVARLLRASGIPTFVAANKADIPEKEEGRYEFEKLGFPVFPVSALHNRGFEPLMDLVVGKLPEAENRSLKNPLRVAIVGRPNVGKSSLVNRILKADRVIVSDVPGTTRDSVDIPFVVGQGDQARHYLLIDTAGMRSSTKVDSEVERYSLMRAERSVGNADVAVLVLDAVAGPTAHDKKIAAFIRDEEKGCCVVINKWDLAAGVTEREYGKAFHREMSFIGYCPVVFASARSGYNIRHCVDAIDQVASQVRADLPTGVLNRTLIDAYERVQPPSVNGRRLKIFYATQVGSAPIRIRIFVNDADLRKDAYTIYLERNLREKFGLEGAPIRIEFKSRVHPEGRIKPPDSGRNPRGAKEKADSRT